MNWFANSELDDIYGDEYGWTVTVLYLYHFLLVDKALAEPSQTLFTIRKVHPITCIFYSD